MVRKVWVRELPSCCPFFFSNRFFLASRQLASMMVMIRILDFFFPRIPLDCGAIRVVPLSGWVMKRVCEPGNHENSRGIGKSEIESNANLQHKA